MGVASDSLNNFLNAVPIWARLSDRDFGDKAPRTVHANWGGEGRVGRVGRSSVGLKCQLVGSKMLKNLTNVSNVWLKKSTSKDIRGNCPTSSSAFSSSRLEAAGDLSSYHNLSNQQ